MYFIIYNQFLQLADALPSLRPKKNTPAPQNNAEEGKKKYEFIGVIYFMFINIHMKIKSHLCILNNESKRI